MNILFLTLANVSSINDKNCYTDLMREFVRNGHSVYIVAPSERRYNEETRVIPHKNGRMLKVKIGNIQKTNIIEKGISTIMIEPQFKAAIKKYFNNVQFDMVMYSTPPITFADVIRYIKKRDNAESYLLLKDIFPQNAVDLGMFSKKSLIYKYFRRKEKKLYLMSDRIGCMSPANVSYLIEHNPYLDASRVEVSPNTAEVQNIEISEEKKTEIRRKYGIPEDRTIFVYGGNLGKPQGIDFVIRCLEKLLDNDRAYFLIVGSGTEFSKLEAYAQDSGQKNLKVMSALPKNEYEILVSTCDVGLIFLDARFTIPNFPSRLLSYMQAEMPVLAATDKNTDIGKIISDNGFGYWCESTDADVFCSLVDKFCNAGRELCEMGRRSKQYLCENYAVEKSYDIIFRDFEHSDNVHHKLYDNINV
ncbi:MAG: glycosyltransferase family 4 protein [Firmicutes bacterium]|nr:glycosyltransferase family 4 protein [Bacillota bacterium]